MAGFTHVTQENLHEDHLFEIHGETAPITAETPWIYKAVPDGAGRSGDGAGQSGETDSGAVADAVPAQRPARNVGGGE
jgi:hypothetical protein